MSAIRLARGFTTRDRILKFAGCYHGHVGRAARERRLRPRDARHPVDARACRPAVTADTIVCAVQRRRGSGRRGRALRRRPRRDHRRAGRREHGRRPAGRRASSRRCAQLCDASGALLVFDEVITGFRVARGGAQERYGVAAGPDHPRQDRRRRAAARGLRRPRGRDGAARAERARLPGGHALRQPARDRRGPLGAAPPPRPGRVRGARARGRAARGGPRGGIGARAAGRRDADGCS